MIQITIDGQVHVDGLSTSDTRYLKQSLSIENPLHAKLKRMGNLRALYACPKYFTYYEENKTTGRLSMGRGVLLRLEAFLKRSGHPYKIIDNRTCPPLSKLDYPKIKLRDYQEGIPEKITAYEQGVIKLPTGFGKTIIGLETARLLGLRTLFVCPRVRLFEQFEEAVTDFFRHDAGRIKGDECTIKDFTVATWQSLEKHIDKNTSITNSFGSIFVDEAHTGITKKRRNILKQFNPKYLYGLTATPRRTDKQDEAIFFTYGDLIGEAEARTTAQASTTRDLSPKTQTRASSQKPRVEIIRYHRPFAHWEYNEIAKSITEDVQRHRRICEVLRRDSGSGRRILVLTKRVAHYNNLHEQLTTEHGGKGIHALSSTAGSARERRKTFDTLREKPDSFTTLLGTFSLLSVGVDLPALDTLVIAGDLRSDVLTEQSVGRILRLFEGKKEPLVIDIWDTGNPILKNQGKERQKFYEKQGWEITWN